MGHFFKGIQALQSEISTTYLYLHKHKFAKMILQKITLHSPQTQTEN